MMFVCVQCTFYRWFDGTKAGKCKKKYNAIFFHYPRITMKKQQSERCLYLIWSSLCDGIHSCVDTGQTHTHTHTRAHTFPCKISDFMICWLYVQNFKDIRNRLLLYAYASLTPSCHIRVYLSLSLSLSIHLTDMYVWICVYVFAYNIFFISCVFVVKCKQISYEKNAK